MTMPRPEVKVRILIAEDSPTQALRLRHILDEQDYEVSVAVHGRQALEMARTHKPSLIISDVVMPEMDGYELTQHLKSDEALRRIPVILVTTLADSQDVIRGLECGADCFVLKPYDEKYLIGRIQFVLINREIQHAQHAGQGVEILFNGQRHYITADRLQILNLLLSTYDAAIQRNEELTRIRKALEQRSADLEVANKGLEGFAASVSHDLRSPLNLIGGYADLLEQGYGEQLDDKGRRFLSVITSKTRHMASLIDSLLTFARSTRQSVNKEWVDMAEMVAQVVASALHNGTSGVPPDIRVGPLPRAPADRVLIQQVWTNLISNAVKYSGKSPSPRIDILGEEQGGEYVYTVRDNGIGFDMAHYDRLFRMFERLQSAKEFEGNGVGLPIVQQIVSRHGGRVWAESAVLSGATFHFTLPLQA